MKLYVTRHGETQWNTQNKVCGITDIELTHAGMEQAKALAARLIGCDIQLIISSPLIRAKQTAHIIAEALGADVIIDDRLREQNLGIYEGVLRTNEKYRSAKRNFACRYPGGESALDVAHRAYSLLDEIKAAYKHKTVLLVGHGSVCRLIDTYFNDMTNERYMEYVLDNCELKVYDI